MGQYIVIIHVDKQMPLIHIPSPTLPVLRIRDGVIDFTDVDAGPIWLFCFGFTFRIGNIPTRNPTGGRPPCVPWETCFPQGRKAFKVPNHLDANAWNSRHSFYGSNMIAQYFFYVSDCNE